MNVINRMNLSNGMRCFDGDEETLIKLMSLNSVLPFVIKYSGSYPELKAKIINKALETEVRQGLLGNISTTEIIKTTWLASLLVCREESFEVEEIKEFVDYVTNYVSRDVLKLCHTFARLWYECDTIMDFEVTMSDAIRDSSVEAEYGFNKGEGVWYLNIKDIKVRPILIDKDWGVK